MTTVLPQLTPEQRAREHSIQLGFILDVGFVTVMIAVSVAGGSFTLLAESIRAVMAVLVECFTFAVLRRIHRGVLADLDYGSGKLEQIANLVIGGGMWLGSAWIATGAMRVVTGERPLGSPIGLALAAIVGMANVYVNLLAWDAVRRVSGTGDSLVMQSQLLLRWTKLFSSLVVCVGLIVAALSTDDVIVAWADALGGFFVAGYMAVNGRRVLWASLPDLLDRSAGEAIQRGIAASLAHHADAYSRVMRVRSRRSGRTAFIDIALEFEPGLTIADVTRRVAALEATIRGTLEHVEVAIQASTPINVSES